MSKIVIGESGKKHVAMDLDVLIRTRLLIQANSGKGKSWLLRRIAEQLFGKVQVIIIDPEGEFATLRERFDYVLVGKGGETAAHPRIAAMTAQRLLELRACAVIDLYEMKPSERHSYVRLFLDAMIDAPKKLWHPVVVILDEAHVYCPEKGAGESEAAEAVIGMATRGRKRGYCLIPATQRLGKFRKDAAAEMLNVAIGGTFIDIDRKRAADALGVYGHDVNPFFDEIRLLERGNFYCLGPAISDTRILVKIGPVETTHPEAGSAKHAAEAPPTPDKIKALLPRLADLPKEAEEKAKTVSDLQAQIRQLKADLKARPIEAASSAPDDRAIQRAIKAATEPLRKQLTEMQRNAVRVKTALAQAQGVIEATIKTVIPDSLSVAITPPTIVTRQLDRPIPARPIAMESVDGELSGPERRILQAMSELASIGKTSPAKNMVAAWSSYSPIGGAFGNPIGKLRSRGLIDYPSAGVITLTEAGRQIIGHVEPPDEQEIWRRIEATCTGPEQKILRALIDNAGQEEISKTELAEKSGYSPIGGAFGNPIGALRTKGLLDYPRQGFVKAADWLFAA